MLPDNEHVTTVLFGESGAAKALPAGALVIDMSTISPVVARDLHARLSARDIGFVDAPVSGGTVGAENAALTIMAGGAADHFERAKPVLNALGSAVVHAGDSGMGQLFKLCNQIICVGNLTAISEALTLCRAGNGDPAALLKAIRGGAAGSWMLENLAPKMIEGDDAFGFPIDLQLKDLRLVGEAAHAMNAPLLTTALITSLYLSARAHGDQRNGSQAIHRIFARLANQDEDR